MNSLTKRDLSTDEINQLTKEAFGEGIKITKIEQLTDGYFNNSFKITLDNQLQVVLKVAPKPDIPVLTYEHNLMKTEVMTLQLMNDTGLPVPKLLFFDESLSIINSSYFFMSYIHGVPLNKVKDQIPQDQLSSIYQDLGTAMKKLRAHTYSIFGALDYTLKQFNSWFSCYKSMISDLIEDAINIGLNLPLTKSETLELIDAFESELSEIQQATLVHKDLWDGNIFVTPDTHQLVGIIDTERAVYAEPLLEIVCGFFQNNEDFKSAYYDRLTLDTSEINRIYLYEFYLYLLMVVECPYRQYPDHSQQQWATDCLEQTILKLKQAKQS